MLRADSVRTAGAPSRAGGFVLYLEGPADRGVLEGWCRQLLPGLARRLSRATVILGGRQPARAIEHFRGLGGAETFDLAQHEGFAIAVSESIHGGLDERTELPAEGLPFRIG